MRIREFDQKHVDLGLYKEGAFKTASRPHEYVLDFHSLDDLVRHVEDSERTWRGYMGYLPSRDTIFHGRGHAFNQDRYISESIAKARYGWKEGRDRLMEWYARLEQEWRKRISSDTFLNDVSGFEVDVPAYLTGLPEQMMALRPGQARSKSVNVTVDLNVRCSACGRRHHDVSPTDPNWVLVRGAAVTMLMKALIRAGYKPKLTGRTTSWYRMDELTHDLDHPVSEPKLLTVNVPIIEPGEVFDLDRVNFAMSHDSMVRRLMWRAEENWILDQRNGVKPKWRDREEMHTVGNLHLRQSHQAHNKSNLDEGEIHIPSIPETEDKHIWLLRRKDGQTTDRQQELERTQAHREAFSNEQTAITWVFDELERAGVRFE